MQSLRRTLSKRGRSKSKDRSTSTNVWDGGTSAAESFPNEEEISPATQGQRSQSQGRGRKTSLSSPPVDRSESFQLPPHIDVAAANSLLADHDIAILTSSPPKLDEMVTPTHVIVPPTPVAHTTYSERERAFSDPQVSHPPFSPRTPSPRTPSPSPSRSPSPSPQNEIDDPLSRHWRQSPKRSSSLLRRLSRTGSHRRSASAASELRRTLSDPPPSPRREDDEDIVFVPEQFQVGIEMLRVTRKKVTKRICWIDPVNACVAWDSKSSSKLYVDDIKALHSTTEARHYREQFHISSSYEPMWLTVVYTSGPKLKALHLISSTVEEHERWYKTLKKLRQHRKEVTGGLAFLMSPERKLNPEKSVRVIRRHWREAGGIGKETAEVGFAEVERLCWKLNVHLSSKYLKEKFDQADSGHRGKLNFEQFQEFVRLLKEREEILNLFKEYAGDSPVLSISQFENFLVKEQKIFYTPAGLKKYYTKFSAKKVPGQSVVEGINADGFLAYLLSKENRVLDAPDLSDSSVVPEKDSPRDMTHPLNEYFISSSHNTYLLGRQLIGESSIEGYIRVLQLGCRCVEIDCWDGVDGWPVVEHGRTFGSSIKFQDVVSVIAKFAFIVTPYPLILSMEIHCGPEQQLKMAQIFGETLGDELLLENLEGFTGGKLPSPDDLKYKILLKIKNTSEDVEEISSDASSTSTDSGTDSDTAVSGEVKRPSIRRRQSSGQSTPGKASKIVSTLSDMAIYTKAYKWRNFKHADCKLFNHVFSFSEPKIKELLKHTHTNHYVEKHNLRHLMRVYPGLTRVTSNNFDPTVFWKNGVQMVALNWQTYDLGMQIQEALFQANYQHGYILKPTPLLASSHPPASHHPTPYESRTCRVKLDVQVISGQQLPRPKDYKPGHAVDPYVQIEVIGPGQTAESRTRAVRDNEFNPMWDEKLSFDLTTSSREFVFVRFSLHNDDKPVANNLFASYCIRLQDMHQGYRHIPLVDLQGEKYIYSTLFVKIKWSLDENIVERPLAGKLEKRAKAKARLSRLEEASRSGTSIESSGSSVTTSVEDAARFGLGGESISPREMEKIAEVNEVNEVKDKV